MATSLRPSQSETLSQNKEAGGIQERGDEEREGQEERRGEKRNIINSNIRYRNLRLVMMLLGRRIIEE